MKILSEGPVSIVDHNAIGEKINEVIADIGLDRADAMLCEGFCPVCQTRSSTEPIIAKDDLPFGDEERKAHAVVQCQTCQIRWRSGPNGGMEGPLPWVEHARTVKDGMILTMTMNAPPDPPNEDDEWYDGEDLDD